MSLTVFVADESSSLKRAAISALTGAGYRVKTVASGLEERAWARRCGAKLVSIDMEDAESVQRAIAGADSIVGLMAKIPSPFGIRSRGWQEANRRRAARARLLVDAAIAEGVPQYIHESAAVVYADAGTRWIDESQPTDAHGSEVLRSITQGERETARFSQLGRRGTVLRFGSFYDDAGTPSTTEVIELVRRRSLYRFGTGRNWISTVHASDAGNAIVAALTLSSGIYNVCDDQPIVLADYLEVVASSVGAPHPPSLPQAFGSLAFGDAWSYMVRSLRVSNACFKSACDWKPRFSSAQIGWGMIGCEVVNRQLGI